MDLPPINCVEHGLAFHQEKTINKLGAFSGRVRLLAVKSPEVARAGVETEIAAPLAARPLIKVLRKQSLLPPILRLLSNWWYLSYLYFYVRSKSKLTKDLELKERSLEWCQIVSNLIEKSRVQILLIIMS